MPVRYSNWNVNKPTPEHQANNFVVAVTFKVPSLGIFA